MISRSIILISIIIIALSIGVYAANQYYTIFNIHGNVNVKDSYDVIDLRLDITSQEGIKVFKDVATVDIRDNTSIQFGVLHSEAIGNLRIVVNGRAILKSSSKEYSIYMPCMLVKDMRCCRILMSIPGYDRPLKVEPGRYSISLEISWKAEGRGTINMKLVMLKIYGSEAQIFLEGTKPYNATGWITANGSTRTYALLVDRINVEVEEYGYGRIRVWTWLFSPSSEDDIKVFRFQLVKRGCGCVVAELNLPLTKHDIYYETLLSVEAKPGEYILKVIFPMSIELEIPITVYRSS